MKRHTWNALVGLILFVLAGTTGVCFGQQATVVFDDRFDGEMKSHWSAAKLQISMTPAGQQRYLGPFNSESVRLNLSDLPRHQFVCVAVDVLILRTWDGNDGVRGPDLLSIYTDDGRLLHCTSFGWYGTQSFPGFFGVNTAAAGSGTTAKGVFGFISDGEPRDGLIRLECVFPHRETTLGLRFVAALNSPATDEAWGIARVRVSLDETTAPNEQTLTEAWQTLGFSDTIQAAAAVWVLVSGRDQTVNWLAQRLRGASIPPAVELLDPSHSRIRPLPAAESTADPYAIEDAAQRRIVLAAHALQIIGTPAAKELLQTLRPSVSPVRTLMVVARDSAGQPVPHLPVWIRTPPDLLCTSVMTDSQGRATIDLPNQELQYVAAQTGQGQYVPVRSNWTRSTASPRPPTTLDLTIQQGVKIGGLVLDDAGKPVEKATVVMDIRKSFGSENSGLNLSYVSAQTDSEGRWNFDLAPETFDTMHLGTYHSRYLMEGDSFYAMNEFKDVAALREERATLVLKRGVPIEVMVHGQDGKPLRGARVAFGADRVASNVMPEQVTDEQGRVFLAGAPNQMVMLAARAEGYMPQSQQFRLEGEMASVRFDLQPGRLLQGQVVDVEGKPIAGAVVIVSPFGRSVSIRINTDKDGRFVWKEAPSGNVSAEILKAGYADDRSAQLNADQYNIVVLKPPTRAVGTVVDDETGEPIKQFTIVLAIVQADGRRSWSRRPPPIPFQSGRTENSTLRWHSRIPPVLCASKLRDTFQRNRNRSPWTIR